MGPFFIVGMMKRRILLLSDSGFRGFTLNCCLQNAFRKGKRGPSVPSISVLDLNTFTYSPYPSWALFFQALSIHGCFYRC